MLHCLYFFFFIFGFIASQSHQLSLCTDISALLLFIVFFFLPFVFPNGREQQHRRSSFFIFVLLK